MAIGDYRGENIPGGFPADGYGQSTVLVNTHKGLWLWNGIKDLMEYTETSQEQIQQPCLQGGERMPPIRRLFIRDVLKKGFGEVDQKYHF